MDPATPDHEVAATAMAAPPAASAFTVETQPRNDPLALAGFIVSLVGLFLVGVILGPVGFILSAFGHRRVTRAGGELLGKGFAVAGMIIGVIDTAAGIYILRLLLS